MDWDKLREEMVQRQLIPRGIKDKKIIEIFLKVPREKFVPQGEKENAYGDFPLPIGEGQTISQPFMVALMTQCLELRGEEKVLEIGTGSGYQTAILAELAKEVYSVERIETLARQAAQRLKNMGYTNIHIRVGNGTLGWPEHAPYSRIIVTAGAKEIPSPLLEQLGEGGIMVIPVGGGYSQDLMMVRKRRGRIKKVSVEKCAFVPLVGQYGWEG